MALDESDYDNKYKLEFKLLHDVVGKMLEDGVEMSTVNLVNKLLENK
jgi:hypothetical protein